ncbi:MAG: 4Fe-4S binding protein [Bacteroidetes bacterium]|nr:4Fe-4S binding protein [Bacteroidota bacterium]MCL5025914.1 4Fe-4S binding protein [Chloroflexota bacterium]
MKVLVEKCTGCLKCIDYCSVGALSKVPGKRLAVVDEDECVECGICKRSGACLTDALFQPEMEWPRRLRAEFSDPTVTHPSTGVGGRGTEEMKTNDVTGRYPRGHVGMAVEMGRPGVGARFYDLEKVQMALARLGVHFEQANPVTALVEDPKTGKLRKDVLNEKVLSAIIEFGTTPDKVPAVLETLRRVAQEIDTVFSLDMCSLIEPDGSVPVRDIALKAGATLRPNGKNNLGMGRPAFQFFKEDAQ